jgi:hypothetical protein
MGMDDSLAERLRDLVAEATADACDEEEQLMGLYTRLEEELVLPFTTQVLGLDVRVEEITLRAGGGAVVLCRHGRHAQAIGILDLPLPEPRPEGSAWIEAYRYWAR